MLSLHAVRSTIQYASARTTRHPSMKFLVKFNALLLATLAIGLAVTTVVAKHQLEEAARSEAVVSARLMMGNAIAVGAYTSGHIEPLLENQMRYTFLAESVPSFAATEVADEMRKLYPGHGYREATLNPMNPRDRASDWEAEVVNRFRADPGQTELTNRNEASPDGKFYVAQPIVVKSEACLQCHGSPDAAPKTLLAKYGSVNGFGWKLNEVVGARIVTMPAEAHAERVRDQLLALVAPIGAVLMALAVVINLALVVMLLRPLKRLAETAEQASMGVDGAPDFELTGNEHIDTLSRAFARMRTSLHKAISMIET